ncbi:MAG: SDR family NAD(P)-dependent oxidoreductase [Melioribacteraceae bacterium]|nr:SDR family NAD(P)-dependent oxidoreductase [Melioribacteraceae bacterium]MCF8265023.1 SDR family NAD(P)-dependent oxidoreductase [Melioribacteraceae bacterium]MCF8413814.1 SDR family NAD(P)-dependent oxidoreductase [Melioribacteraceae bacterium]
MAQVSIVTGASRGIGRAIALKFASENHKIAIFGRDRTRLNSVESELNKLGAEVLSFSGDVADQKFVNDSIAEIYKKFGTVDNLINNAGIAHFDTFLESSLERFKEQIDANILGVYNFTKAVIDKMIAQNSGSIVNIASLAGKNGFVRGTTYAATKHAVMGFSKSLLLEVRKHNIRVIAICPGSVATEMITDSIMNPQKLENILNQKDIADTVSSVLKLPARALVSELEIRPTNP